MARAKSRSGQRPRKRRYYGKRRDTNSTAVSSAGASAKKLGNKSCSRIDDVEYPSSKGYRLFDIQILFAELEQHLSCRVCGNDITVTEDLVHGLSSRFKISCSKCGELSSFRNSKMLGVRKNIPEINRRSIYAMQCIGRGLTHMRTFCGIMDLPPPVSQKTFEATADKIKDAVYTVAETSMKNAVTDELKLTEDLQDGIRVSGDGTWKTRGHTSLIGVCTVIGVETGKVVDVEVLSSFCRGCAAWKGKRIGIGFEEWWKEHLPNCTKNHSGSAAKMEVHGMLNIFQRSEASRGTKYVEYVGDGDCKTYLEIKKCEPYGPGIEIKKTECVAHVKKRMGSRLRALKKEFQGKKLSDGKSLSGKGRLTDKMIDKFSYYYGSAILDNKNSLMEMRRAVWAIYYHTRSTDNEPTHNFCPKGVTSWCGYKRAAAEGHNFQHKTVVPAAIMDTIKKVFKDLSAPDLLHRCLGGRTQNANESLNSVIWSFCPKTSGAGLRLAQFATYEAVVAFNEGCKGRLKTMELLGVKPGNFARAAAEQADKRRVKQSEIRALERSLEARRAKKRLTSQHNVKTKAEEGIVYAAGHF